MFLKSLERKTEVEEISPVRATQGATVSDGKARLAEHAIDKDLSTMATTTTSNGNGWLKLELAKIYVIDLVIIYNRFKSNWYNSNTDCGPSSSSSFKDCVDEANNVDVSVYQAGEKVKSCGTLQLG